MKPPKWFCTGWWSPWCVLDELLHWVLRRGWTFDGGLSDLPGWLSFVCRRHDRAVNEWYERDELGKGSFEP